MNMLCYFITLSQKATMSNKAFLAAKVMFFHVIEHESDELFESYYQASLQKKPCLFFVLCQIIRTFAAKYRH